MNFMYSATRSVKLEPTGILYVCPGGSLAVNCSTNATVLTWSIKFPSQQSPMQIDSFQIRGQITTTMVPVNSVTLNVSLVNNLRLLSTVSANNLVTAHLNGSFIICSDSEETQDSVQIMSVGGNVDSKLSKLPSLFTSK